VLDEIAEKDILKGVTSQLVTFQSDGPLLEAIR